jgi:deoxyribose-phosphate aldolase
MAPSDERNPGIPLDLTWVHEAHVNKSGIDRRAAEIGTRRGVKKQFQAGWLLRAVTNIDLTTLAGDDTPSNVQRLCAKAKAPIRKDILEKLGCADLNITCGAVCVYPARVKDAVAALEGTGIPVAAVATGFPSGQIKHEHKLEEIRGAVADGATEIDIVINREAALAGDWERVYHEVQDFREGAGTLYISIISHPHGFSYPACGEAHMKSILAVGELHTLTNVHRARWCMFPSYLLAWSVRFIKTFYVYSLVCMMAGSDFIKTSTGKEPVNATIANSLVMLRSLREYLQVWQLSHALLFYYYIVRSDLFFSTYRQCIDDDVDDWVQGRLQACWGYQQSKGCSSVPVSHEGGTWRW